MRRLIVLAALGVLVAATARADDLAPRANVVRVEHRPAADNPGLGPSSAPVVAELFLVPGQIESNRAYKRLVELQSRHPRRLRVVFRVITRQAQVVIPIAALEAYAQGKFDEFMDAIVAARSGAVRREQLPAIAEAAGMDAVRLDQALERALDLDQLPEPLRDNDRRRLRQRGANVPELLFNGAPVGQTLSALDVEELERYYDDAYAAAQALIADGVPAEQILEASERALAPTWAVTFESAAPIDDPEPGWEQPEGPPPLLDKTLGLDGLPSEGGDAATVEMIVLCNLRYVSCRQQLDAVGRRLHDLYPDEIRLVWHPWYDVAVEGNQDAPRLHAAALCAEAQGAGWKWIDETMRQVMRGAAEGDVETMIDAVAELAEVDRVELDRCIARLGDEVDRKVADAIAAGVTHGPAIVIGGRIYEGGFTDWRAAAPLVDAELGPGLLERMVPDWER